MYTKNVQLPQYKKLKIVGQQPEEASGGTSPQTLKLLE
jgi:hypothetical protein